MFLIYFSYTLYYATLQLNSLLEGYAESNGYLNILYTMLFDDPDAAVITNVLMVLNELLIKTGGISLGHQNMDTGANIITVVHSNNNTNNSNSTYSGKVD